MIKLIDILNEVTLPAPKFPLPFKSGGVNLTGEAAWNKWRRWADINRKDKYIDDVLNTIKRNNYQTTQRQLDVLVRWFSGVRESLLEAKKKRDRCLRIADRRYKTPSAYKSGAAERCRQGDIWKDIKEELIREKTKETLRTWFKRQGPKGKEGGWIDCNAPDGKGGYKACGRKKGEKRAKYPACKATAAQCKAPGKGKTWGKKSK